MDKLSPGKRPNSGQGKSGRAFPSPGVPLVRSTGSTGMAEKGPSKKKSKSMGC